VTAALQHNAAARELIRRVHATDDLERAYPLVFDREHPERLVVLEEAGEVRAACAILPREFALGEARVRAGLIGSVSTDAAWRGRGLGTRLLATAEAELARAGCLFALLWAEDPGYYLRRGYAPIGAEDDYLLVSELAEALPAPSGVRALRPEDVPALARLHAAHPARILRTPAEFAALLSVPGMTVLVRERALLPHQPPVPVAYACLGRGRDLADAIHEWAGASEDVLALVRAHLERRFPGREPGALFLMAPTSAGELGYRLLRAGAVSKRGILGLGKLLDRERTAAFLRERLGTQATVDVQGEKLELRGPRERAELDDDALLALILGAHDVRDEARRLLARLGLEKARLPLEPFAWGLDSI
jgi:predicted N-acetyltransferase YhbS